MRNGRGTLLFCSICRTITPIDENGERHPSRSPQNHGVISEIQADGTYKIVPVILRGAER